MWCSSLSRELARPAQTRQWAATARCWSISHAAMTSARRAAPASPSAAQTMHPLMRMFNSHARDFVSRRPASSARDRTMSRMRSSWARQACPMRPRAPTIRPSVVQTGAAKISRYRPVCSGLGRAVNFQGRSTVSRLSRLAHRRADMYSSVTRARPTAARSWTRRIRACRVLHRRKRRPAADAVA